MQVQDSFDINFIKKSIPGLLAALPVTLRIALISALAGVLAGLLLALGKTSRHKVLSWCVNTLTVIFRGIPTVVLLYLVYFGLPFVSMKLFQINLSKWEKQTFVIIALAIELSVTCSEMFRSAYNSLDKGQLEAAHALGMTKLQRFFRIIVPQAVYVILPNLNNAALSIIQGTVLVYTLGIMDIMGKARVLDTNALHLKTFEAYLVVAIIYWILSIIISWVFKILERCMGRGQKTAGTV